MKDTLSEMKNNLQGIYCMVDEAENQIINLKNKVEENTQSEQQKEKKNF